MMVDGKKLKVLVTGVSGLLGSNLSYCWRERYDILGVYHRHPWSLKGIKTQLLDLTDADKVCAIIAEFKPDRVVHTAAIADVELCQTQPQLAQQTNVTVTKNLVDAARDVKHFVYISTDLVYDGIKGQYAETDPVGLINTYAETKFAGEREASRHPRALLARTNFYGWNVQDKLSLAEWGISELSHSKNIKGFTDAIFSSIYTFDLAEILAKAMEQNLAGIYHMVSQGAMSKFDFLRLIARRTGMDEGLISPASISQFPFKAKRAKNLSLRTEKLARDLALTVPAMEQSFEHFIRDYHSCVLGQLNACPKQNERFVLKN